jgi:hypothetical protein
MRAVRQKKRSEKFWNATKNNNTETHTQAKKEAEQKIKDKAEGRALQGPAHNREVNKAVNVRLFIKSIFLFVHYKL